MVLLSLLYVSVAAELSLLGQTKAVDVIYGLKVVGGTAYTAAGASGLVAVDVKKPDETKELWRVETGGGARGVDVAGDVVYVADRGSGLQIIQKGSVVGQYSEPCIGVQVSGGVAYLRSNLGDVFAIDVADPTTPELLGKYNESFAESLFVVDTTVYTTASNGSNGATRDLNIIDFSNPSSPVLLGSVDTNLTYLIGNTFVDDDTAYLATGVGFLIFDVADPSSPSFRSRYDSDFASNIYVANHTAYLNSNTRGFSIVDVSSDPPLLLGERVATQNRLVQVEGGVAYVASNGIEVLDVRTTSNPTLLGEFKPPGGFTRGVAVSGDFAYIVGDKTVLRVVDISNPLAPTVVGSYGGTTWARAVQVVGSTVYVASCRYFFVFDVSTPQKPRVLGTYRTNGMFTYCASSVDVIGTVAYVGTHSDGFEVLDVSSPSNIKRVGKYDLSRCNGVLVSGTTAYVVSSRGLTLIDVGTPSAPMLISNVRTGTSQGVTGSGTTIYVAGRTGLTIVDVSTPSAPSIVGNFATPQATGVKVVGEIALISGSEGLQLVDVSNPSAPTLIDGYSKSAFNGIAVMGNLAYMAEVGMSVIEVWNGTLAPPTAEPTVAPMTPAPPTPAPATPAPPTPAPATPAPPTPAPSTPAPRTPAPATPAPSTPAPPTPSPRTPAPRTTAPATEAPRTASPATPAPGTSVPGTTTTPATTSPTLSPAGGNGGDKKTLAIVLIVLGVALVLVISMAAGVWWWKNKYGGGGGANEVAMGETSKTLPSERQV
eukprot:TRINITY_DN143_c0_g1_i4.p1 TRINITY_DN143_c0_g1~~TRINITY_DN143_c0_g1_i4.p1  ORF type:complete len:766 (+),score=200.64 TRINITY_DN143_c0_g1_i4:37-2334(+)